MSIAPHQLVEISKPMAAEADEAFIRAAISRSYYGAYHGARIFHAGLTTPGSVGTAKGSHEQLIAALDNPTIARGTEYWTSKGISKTLRLALAARVTADYHLDEDVGVEMATLVIGQAEEILRRANQLAVATSTVQSAGA